MNVELEHGRINIILYRVKETYRGGGITSGELQQTRAIRELLAIVNHSGVENCRSACILQVVHQLDVLLAWYCSAAVPLSNNS